jgi:hypothetical protein
MEYCSAKKTQAEIAIQSPSNMPIISSRVLCGRRHTHSTFLVGTGLQRVEKPCSSRELPHFLLSNQQLLQVFDLVI